MMIMMTMMMMMMIIMMMPTIRYTHPFRAPRKNLVPQLTPPGLCAVAVAASAAADDDDHDGIY